jgi:hypothetical protein
VRLDLNISNSGDDAGKRRGFGVDQVDASLLARLPSVVYRFLKPYQLSMLLVVHVPVRKTRSGPYRGVQDGCSCLVPLNL